MLRLLCSSILALWNHNAFCCWEESEWANEKKKANGEERAWQRSLRHLLIGTKLQPTSLIQFLSVPFYRFMDPCRMFSFLWPCFSCIATQMRGYVHRAALLGRNVSIGVSAISFNFHAFSLFPFAFLPNERLWCHAYIIIFKRTINNNNNKTSWPRFTFTFPSLMLIHSLISNYVTN